MTNDIYLNGVKETGFELEFLVSKILIKSGWTVINNKYYIDDVQGASREIDIVAYKVTSKNNIQIYTVLILSCKKSAENTWALLAKDKNIKDPNIDWTPVSLWSNQKAIKLIIENYDWKEKYVTSSAKLHDDLFSPSKHIFAFQELNTKTGKPKNDKAIFNSIITSMKSQNYEMASLEKRKKEESVYNFNLISVIDAPLIRVNYGGTQPKVEKISSDIYVGSYIIDKKETVSRVHFIIPSIFDSCLSTYNNLHDHNVAQSVEILESYYIDCLKDRKKVNLFKDKFNHELRWDVYTVIRDLRPAEKVKLHDVGVGWDKKKDCATIEVSGVYENKELNALNTNNKIKVTIAKALKEIYNYEGSFYFDSDVPF